MMNFANLEYIIYILPPAIILLIMIFFYGWWRRYSIKQIFRNRIPETIKKSYKIIIIREILLVLSILLFVIILLRPQWGTKLRPVTKEGSDLLIILDVSRSMDSNDVSPSRIERAKSAVKYITANLEGDRVALEIFAGDNFLQCPFTSDIGAFQMFLESVNTDSLNVQGTDIGSALNKAVDIFKKRKMTNRLVLLITDGEDHEQNVEGAIDKLKEADVKIYTAGIGTTSGKPIPMKNDNSDLYKRDQAGKIVKSKRNNRILKLIASRTNGEYLDINSSFNELKGIKSELRKHNSKTSKTQMIREPLEKYQIFTIIIIILLTMEVFVISPFWRFKK